MPPASDLERALQLLALPLKSVCIRRPPSQSRPASAAMNPFILHDGTYANLPSLEEVFAIGINARSCSWRRKRPVSAKGPIPARGPRRPRGLGEHQAEGGKVQVLSGRYVPLRPSTARSMPPYPAPKPATLSLNEAVEAESPSASARGRAEAKGGRKTGKGGSEAGQNAAVARRTRPPRARSRRPTGRQDPQDPQDHEGQAQESERHARGGGIGRDRQDGCPASAKNPGLRRPAKQRRDHLTSCAAPTAKVGKREIARAFRVKRWRSTGAEKDAGGNDRCGSHRRQSQDL